MTYGNVWLQEKSPYLDCEAEVQSRIKNNFPSDIKVKRRRGRVEDLLRNKSVKSGRPTMYSHNFDTQRNLAIDSFGTRENISMSRSTGIGSDHLSMFFLPTWEIVFPFRR